MFITKTKLTLKPFVSSNCTTNECYDDVFCRFKASWNIHSAETAADCKRFFDLDLDFFFPLSDSDELSSILRLLMEIFLFASVLFKSVQSVVKTELLLSNNFTPLPLSSNELGSVEFTVQFFSTYFIRLKQHVSLILLLLLHFIVVFYYVLFNKTFISLLATYLTVLLILATSKCNLI